MIAAIAGFIAVGWIIAFSNPDPIQTQAMHELFGGSDTEHIVLNSQEVRDKLSICPNLQVKQQSYAIPKAYEMPKGKWCKGVVPHTSYLNEHPIGWNTQDYAWWATAVMHPYAFGIVYENNGNALNVLLIEDKGKVKVAFYNAFNCMWEDAPVDMHSAVLY